MAGEHRQCAAYPSTEKALQIEPRKVVISDRIKLKWAMVCATALSLSLSLSLLMLDGLRLRHMEDR